MDGQAGRETLAREAIAAMGPVVELLLEIGITSPEAESLLRGLFVHKSRDWLGRLNEGNEPSDVRIALVTGVHRNFVRRLLAVPPSIPVRRQRKGHRASRLLRAWYDEPLYQDSSGKPRDLPKKGSPPSFEALATRYLPGSTPAVVLQELHRAGVVQLLPEERVRIRSRTMRTLGINSSTLHELSHRLNELSMTILHNAREPDARLLCESMPPVVLDQSRLSVIREVINRRATGFLQSLHAELSAERRRRSTRRGKEVKVSLTVFEGQVT